MTWNIPRIRIDRGRIWKGDILVADFEELENLDASTAKLCGRDHEIRESTPRQYDPVGSEDLSEELQRNSEEPQTAETKEDAEARNDFWSIAGDFIFRHHVEPRVHLYVPKEESFPIPLKYIEMTRTTHTNLDVLQENRIDDNWKVDVDRNLSDSWTGFTKITLLNEKPSPG